MPEPPLVGVLAIQGGFQAHIRVLESLGVRTREVRTAAELEGLDAVVIPGGESTTMSLGIEREGLAEPLRALVREGTPTLGTCAGLIVLDRDHLGLLDVSCRRNAFGRQVRSFEADLDLGQLGELHAVFIRAPWVEEAGPGVEVLAEIDGHPVAVSKDNLLAVAFHPELSATDRLHRWLVHRAGHALQARDDDDGPREAAKRRALERTRAIAPHEAQALLDAREADWRHDQGL